MSNDFIGKKDCFLIPTFEEFVHATKKLFSSGYYEGKYQVEAKTKSTDQIDFLLDGNSDPITGITVTSLNTRFYAGEKGITISATWKTTNDLISQIQLADFLGVKGLTVGSSCLFAPYSRKRRSNVQITFTRDSLSANLMMERNEGYPNINISFLTRLQTSFNGQSETSSPGCHNIVAGGDFKFDLMERKVLQSFVTWGYYTENFLMSTFIKDGMLFGAGLYRRVNPRSEMGWEISYNIISNKSLVGIGGQYHLSPVRTVKFKLNTARMFGVSLSWKIRPEVKIIVSTETGIRKNAMFGAGMKLLL